MKSKEVSQKVLKYNYVSEIETPKNTISTK